MATTPTTPPSRPARSIHRLSAYSILSSSSASASTPFDDPPPLPKASSTPSTPSAPFTPRSPFSDADTDGPRTPTTPSTPSYPRAARQSLTTRKSSASIRRKPLPVSIGDIELEMGTLPPHSPLSTNNHRNSTSAWAGSERRPPTYILPVDPPLTPTSPPAYLPSTRRSAPAHAASSTSASASASAAAPHTIEIDIGVSGFHSPSRSTEDLPRYTPEGEGETEPKTLARSLWRWGWLFPLFWAVGMFILWIPLRPEEEEADPEKAQKLEEMIVILRKTELKYAQRCLWSFIGFVGLVTLAVIIGVVLSKTL